MAIVINVLKMLVCRTPTLGYRLFHCIACSLKKIFCFSCKSRFCASCGKKATDIWMQNSYNRLPQTRWQHITFTMPNVLWDIFCHNRHLINKVAPIPANIIKTQANKQGFIPGIYLAIHTFGRDLKRNLHIHLSTTAAGLSFDHKRWISKAYFDHQKLKDCWKYEIINLLRKQYKDTEQPLVLPAKLKHLRNYTAFNSWLNFLYQKKWVVHLNEQSDDHKNNTQYLGKYLKRPPIGETRIKAYDGKEVTYEYLDHYTKETHTMTLPALEFIGPLVTHIADQHFRTIRLLRVPVQSTQWQTHAHCLHTSEPRPTQEKSLHPMAKDALGAFPLQSFNLSTLRKKNGINLLGFTIERILKQPTSTNRTWIYLTFGN